MKLIIKKLSIPVLITALFSLTACGGGGSSDPGTTQTTNEAPTITMGADKTVDSASVNVEVSGLGSDSDGSIVTYSWSQTAGPAVTLSDTSAASASFTAPTVSTATTLTFSLTVTDNDGATATNSMQVVVNAVVINAAPTANAGTDQTVTSGVIGSIALNAGGSTDSDGSIVSYNWVQTTGDSVVLTGSDTGAPSFPIPAVSTNTSLTFTLTVTDDGGATATDDVVVLVTNSAPIANAGVDQTVSSGAVVTLNGSGTDSDGTVTGFSWSQTGGPTVSLISTVNTVSGFDAPTVTVDTDFTFNLVVTDNNGGATGTDEVVITVTPIANVAPVANAGNDQSVVSGSGGSISLDASGSTDSDGSISSYSWAQTSGTTVTLTGAGTATASFTTPAVSANAAYTFTLTVTDNDGDTATDLVTISVTNAAPVADAGVDQTVASGADPVSLDGSGSADSDGGIGIYSWVQTGGATVTLANSTSATPSFTAPTVTTDTQLTFELTVTDNNGGATAVDVVAINITSPGLEVTVSTSDVKTVQFSWGAFSGATSYKLFVNADGVSGMTLQTDSITGTSTSVTLPVHFTDWANAKYQLEAHDGSGLIKSSAEFSITSEMLNTIGYVKSANPSTNDNFGFSVSLSADGNTLAVGALYESGSSAGVNGVADDALTSSGAVYVFARSGASWTQQAYIKAGNPTASDLFGYAVSLSANGDVLAVGSPFEDSNTVGINSTPDDAMQDTGAAYIYTRSGTTWTQQAYIKASNSRYLMKFGLSLDLASDGLTLAVGSVGEDSETPGINSVESYTSAGLDTGAVYVFVYGGSPAAWTEQAYIKTETPTASDSFGVGVSLSSDGNTLVACAMGEDGSGTGVDSTVDELLSDSGAAYVFSRSGATWTQQAYIKASNPDTLDLFGTYSSLSPDGNTLAISAYGEDGSSTGINGADDDLQTDSGAVYIYSRSGTTWTQQAYVKTAASSAFDRLGGVGSPILSQDGNLMAVPGRKAIPRFFGQPDFEWVVYLFNRTGSVWSQQGYTVTKETLSQDGFESLSLSADGNTMVVGSPKEDGSATGVNGVFDDTLSNPGAVYLY